MDQASSRNTVVNNDNGNSPLCRLVRTGRTSFIKQLSNLEVGNLTENSAKCRITDRCNEVSCSVEVINVKYRVSISSSKHSKYNFNFKCNMLMFCFLLCLQGTLITGSMYLSICDEKPYIELSSSFLNSTWSQKFETKQVPQLSPAIFRERDDNPYIKSEVYFVIYDKNVFLNATLKLCKNSASDCDKIISILFIPGMHINTLCHFEDSLLE